MIGVAIYIFIAILWMGVGWKYKLGIKIWLGGAIFAPCCFGLWAWQSYKSQDDEDSTVSEVSFLAFLKLSIVRCNGMKFKSLNY